MPRIADDRRPCHEEGARRAREGRGKGPRSEGLDRFGHRREDQEMRHAVVPRQLRGCFAASPLRSSSSRLFVVRANRRSSVLFPEETQAERSRRFGRINGDSSMILIEPAIFSRISSRRYSPGSLDRFRGPMTEAGGSPGIARLLEPRSRSFEESER